MTRKDIDDIISILCPNDEDYEKPIISPKYLRQELEQLALEQEPCEDAISRQDVIREIHDTIFTFFNVCGDNEEIPMDDKDELLLSVNKAICNNVKAMKPVIPEPKIGHWIDKFAGVYRCSCCEEITSIDTEIDFPNGIRYKYCPWCGCKMVENKKARDK